MKFVFQLNLAGNGQLLLHLNLLVIFNKLIKNYAMLKVIIYNCYIIVLCISLLRSSTIYYQNVQNQNEAALSLIVNFRIHSSAFSVYFLRRFVIFGSCLKKLNSCFLYVIKITAHPQEKKKKWKKICVAKDLATLNHTFKYRLHVSLCSVKCLLLLLLFIESK